MSEQSGHQHNGLYYAEWKGLRRGRPWLLPSNRKLRHLQAISVRNLTLSQPATRPRGYSIDDASLPIVYNSPVKLLAQSERNKLEHSRSSGDLKSPTSKDTPKKPVLNGSGVEVGERRPRLHKLRRRSTLNWTGASPAVRQKKLEDVTGGRMADTWFSLHCKGVEEPIYISEEVEKAMNPNFIFFDLAACGPSVTRRDEITVRVWARSEHMNDYRLLIVMELHLGSLQFIGKTLESFHHPLPSNCILFHLSDGIYTSFTDMPPEEALPEYLGSPRNFPDAQPTSSFDALMRLSNLDDCIQDALATREKLASQISSILQENQKSMNTINEASQIKDSLASVQRSLMAERKQLRAATARRRDLQASLQARPQAMREGSKAQQKAQEYLSGAQSKLQECRTLVEKNREDIRGQIRRIAEDLWHIYPIDPVPYKPLLFTIRGLPLPNSNYDDVSTAADEEAIDAVLGFVAHLVYLLSFYLSVPLPYPIQPYASQSFIKDPISILPAGQRTFPLYRKASLAYRFDYGVFLLNKDIELLMARQGLKILDVRHTLPNLKYLLYVLTARSKEVPGRKAGGVKGLLRAQHLGAGTISPSTSPYSLSRRGSEDDNDAGTIDLKAMMENEVRGKGKERMATLAVTHGIGKVPSRPSLSPLRTGTTSV